MAPLFFLERSLSLNLIVYHVQHIHISLVNMTVQCVCVCVCIELDSAICSSATNYMHHWPFLMLSSSISVKRAGSNKIEH